MFGSFFSYGAQAAQTVQQIMLERRNRQEASAVAAEMEFARQRQRYFADLYASYRPPEKFRGDLKTIDGECAEITQEVPVKLIEHKTE